MLSHCMQSLVYPAGVAKSQQQLPEHEHRPSTAEQRQQLLQAEQQAVQQRIKPMEDQKAEREKDLQDENRRSVAIEQQVGG